MNDPIRTFTRDLLMKAGEPCSDADVDAVVRTALDMSIYTDVSVYDCVYALVVGLPPVLRPSWWDRLVTYTQLLWFAIRWGLQAALPWLYLTALAAAQLLNISYVLNSLIVGPLLTWKQVGYLLALQVVLCVLLWAVWRRFGKRILP